MMERVWDQSESLWQVIDAVSAGVLLMDSGRRILRANSVAEEYLPVLTDVGVGGTLTHLDGHPIEDVLSSYPTPARHELAVNGSFNRVFEVAARRLVGTLEAPLWALILRDVTKERETQQLLHHQQGLAAVGQLATGIAHDLNNTLMGVIGLAELLAKRADVPESAKGDLKSIAGAGLHAAYLIRQTLAFSRKSVACHRPLELAPFLKESIRFLRCTIPESVQIILEIPPDDYLIHADPARVQQAFTNLAVNARDAMPDGGELRIRLGRLELGPGEPPPSPGMSPGKWVVLSVSDTGIGIAPETLPHIFDPFFTTKEASEGIGLGLAQVCGVVKRHDGHISVESQVGKGTTFTVYLPALAVNENTGEGVGEEMSRAHGETVLLVEDDRQVLMAGKAMLEHMGYQVLTAGDGVQALEAHSTHRGKIALVLSDLVMPRMSAVELYHLLRERDPTIRMVVVSGYPLKDEIEELLNQGITSWVQKPLLLEDLAQVLHRALTEQHP